ncbi:riboflavin synthase [Pigmentibacter sp. JX0631]|uniref:riboflavin synthase n=1 Tax=Pigmentibacter sp. JX0631 TaxID=2976982 RepID=UPI0024690D6C|nr:riboflavin synthase [Pigmentibacter sp. JX0631]WGL58981.1 riboflavin synthase [Pigmentibacter sp. JX0631]
MFTGIVRDLGKVEFLLKCENSLKLTISSNLDISFYALGASVSCNGCCLTVIESYAKNKISYFTVDVGYQSLALTNLGKLKLGSILNIEPALRLGDSLGGHHVTGHVDALCNISYFEKLDDEFWKLKINIPQEFSQWIILKGSIAVAGISLTIAKIDTFQNGDSVIEIMIIPHTFSNTILHEFRADMEIEIEFDQTVKTIASVVKNMLPGYIQARK